MEAFRIKVAALMMLQEGESFASYLFTMLCKVFVFSRPHLTVTLLIAPCMSRHPYSGQIPRHPSALPGKQPADSVDPHVGLTMIESIYVCAQKDPKFQRDLLEDASMLYTGNAVLRDAVNTDTMLMLPMVRIRKP